MFARAAVVPPHLGVHRGRDDHRRLAREHGVAEQVVGEAGGELAIVFAVAGAITMRSAACPMATCRTSATPS